MSASSMERIRALNDSFRTTFVGGAVMLSEGVESLDEETRRRLLERVRDFNKFEEGNDPFQEHDFGAIDLEGNRYLFKLDYYDRKCRSHSPDPANPDVTTRILTVLKAEEY